MTRTSVKLVFIYSIQTISLFACAFYLSIQHSYSNSGNSKTNKKWSRIHYPFTTDRRGLSYLESRDRSSGGILSILDQIRKDYHDINRIQFYVTNHGSGGGNDGSNGNLNVEREEDDLDSLIPELLQRGLDTYSHQDDSTRASVTVKSSTPLNVDSKYNCIEMMNLHKKQQAKHKDNSDNIDDDQRKDSSEYEILTYQIHVIHDCHDSEKTKIDINDFGDVLISFGQDTTLEKKKYVLEHSISKFLSSWLVSISSTSPQQSNALSSYSSIKFISTLIDSDPMSHVSSKTTTTTANTTTLLPMHHHQLLSRVFQDQMDQSILPMINQLSEKLTAKKLPKSGLYRSSNLFYHGIAYIGQDFVRKAIYSEYENDTSYDYTISLKTAEDIIYSGEIGNAIGLFDSSSAVIDEDDDTDEIVWNILFFVPPSSSIPLFIQSEDNEKDGSSSWSPAFATSRNNILFSSVNIDYNKDKSDNQTLEGREQIYQEAIRQSISYIGAQIRKQFGLTSTPLNAMSEYTHFIVEEDEIMVKFNYNLPTSLGVAPWEVDSLIRQSWSSKVERVVQLIERTVKLSQSRNTIAIPIEVRILSFIFLELLAAYMLGLLPHTYTIGS